MLGRQPLGSQPLGSFFPVVHATADQSFAPFSASETGSVIVKAVEDQSFAPFTQSATAVTIVKASADQTYQPFTDTETARTEFISASADQDFTPFNYVATGHAVPVPPWTIEYVKIRPADRTLRIDAIPRVTIGAGPGRTVRIAHEDRTITVLDNCRSVKVPAQRAVTIPFERRTVTIRRAA